VPRVPNGIVTLKNRTLNPTARLFIEQARDKAICEENVLGAMSPSDAVDGSSTGAQAP
jgi:hypothetical protein